MYIKKISIKNIRTFDEVDIDLNNNSKEPDWVMILGDNGVGKSTLLRSITLGLCDEMGAAGLLRELPGNLRKNEKENVKIIIDLIEDDKTYRIKTEIHGIPKKTEKIKREYKEIINNQEIDYKESNGKHLLDKIFMCGYGAGRGADGTEDYLEYSIVDAVYTLFRCQAPNLWSKVKVSF